MEADEIQEIDEDGEDATSLPMSLKKSLPKTARGKNVAAASQRASQREPSKDSCGKDLDKYKDGNGFGSEDEEDEDEEPSRLGSCPLSTMSSMKMSADGSMEIGTSSVSSSFQFGSFALGLGLGRGPLGKISEIGHSPSSAPSRPSQRASRKSFMTSSQEDTFNRFSMGSSLPKSDASFCEEEGETTFAEFLRVHRRMRLKLWLFLEDPWDTPLSCIASMVLVVTIVFSIWHSIFESSSWADITDISSIPPITLWDKALNAVFAVDSLFRFWAWPVHCKFLNDPKNAIDIVSLLPFFINHVVGLPTYSPMLQFLRWANVFDASLRFLKLARYFGGWLLLFHSIRTCARALVLPLLFMMVIVFFGSCSLYLFEALEAMHGNEASVSIQSLPDSIHFVILCILTMSTGPFYEMEAYSSAARIVAAIIVCFGILLMAMPIAIVGSCFSQTWFDQDRIVLLSMVRSRLKAQGYQPEDLRDVFDEVDTDESGEIDLIEFRRMIATFNFPTLNPAKCRRLFAYFDHDADGAINFSDFAFTLYPDLGDIDSDDDASETSDVQVEVGRHYSVRLESEPEQKSGGWEQKRSEAKSPEDPELHPPPPAGPVPFVKLSSDTQAGVPGSPDLGAMSPCMSDDEVEDREANSSGGRQVADSFADKGDNNNRGSVQSEFCFDVTKPMEHTTNPVVPVRRGIESMLSVGSATSFATNFVDRDESHVRLNKINSGFSGISNGILSNDKDRFEQILFRLDKRLERQMLEVISLLRNSERDRPVPFSNKGFAGSMFSSRAASRRTSTHTDSGASRRASKAPMEPGSQRPSCAPSARGSQRPSCTASARGSQRPSASPLPRTPGEVSKAGSRRQSVHYAPPQVQQGQIFTSLAKWYHAHQPDTKKQAARRPSQVFFHSVQPKSAKSANQSALHSRRGSFEDREAWPAGNPARRSSTCSKQRPSGPDMSPIMGASMTGPGRLL